MAPRRSRLRTKHVVAISVVGMLIGFAIGIGLAVADTRAVPTGAAGRTSSGVRRDTAGALLAAAVAVGCASSWVARGLFNARARSAPTSEWRVRICLATRRGLVGGVLVSLTPVDATVVPVGRYWQRVLWSPALGELARDQVVRARLRPGRFGRAVIESPDGSLIWPAGRLRRRAPLTPRAWPPSWRRDRPRLGPFVALCALLIPLAGGIVVRAALSAPPRAVAAFAVCCYALWFHLWGWLGGVVARVPRRPEAPEDVTWWGTAGW
jgi:hypothetical protein